MKRSILLLLIFLLSLGCSSDDGQDNIDDQHNTTEVRLRITNTSGYNYQDIRVNPGSSIADYGDLQSGESSDYQVFKTAYNYGYVEIKIRGSIFKIQPYDYFGETPLKIGDYTYKIDAKRLENTDEIQLISTFIED